jgi:Mg-chelatase subunit ChlD
MTDPVVAVDGRSYERAAIERWFETHQTSPLTNQTIATTLISNYALKDAIESYLNPQPVSTEAQNNDHLALGVNSIRLDERTILLNTTIKPLTEDIRKPSVFICIIDVSGSMGSEASIATNGAENDGFTRLDLVKHSVKTIINVLDIHDMLAIVAFTETASIALPLTPMNNQGKQRAEEALSNLEPLNSTNIWDGLRVALEISSGAACKNKNVASLLLTDG